MLRGGNPDLVQLQAYGKIVRQSNESFSVPKCELRSGPITQRLCAGDDQSVDAYM